MIFPRPYDPNYVPWCDPPIQMTLGKPGGRLITDDGGGKFEIEGNIRLAALAVLEYALVGRDGPTNRGTYRCSGISFSRFEFDFTNGIQVKQRDNEDDKVVTDFIEEIKKLTNLIVFL